MHYQIVVEIHNTSVNHVSQAMILLLTGVIQGDSLKLKYSLGLLLRRGSIPGPIIRWQKFTDARTS